MEPMGGQHDKKPLKWEHVLNPYIDRLHFSNLIISLRIIPALLVHFN